KMGPDYSRPSTNGTSKTLFTLWAGVVYLGLLLEEKPELKRVLEQRRLELHKEAEMAQRQPSDLEMELRKRQQKLQEQEEIRRRENQQKIPEFVRVKDNLRRTQTFEQ
uniref:Si:ch211-160o17.6 n=1 Tax=Amphilophus citrinellus TaxID=61819 RepID=A0A3Q0QXT4_AMPCI